MANYQDNIQVDLNQGRQVVQPQVTAGAHTMLAFKVEQSKVPKYFEQETKETISALYFIHPIDDLARTNNNFANALWVFARKWLFSTVDMLDYTEDQLTWINLKPRLQVNL